MTAADRAAKGPGVETEPSDSPLAGWRVLVTRAAHQAPALAERIVQLGGEAVVAPMIAIEPGDATELASGVRRLAEGAYVAVCLTSPNGVEALADAMRRADVDTKALADTPLVACVGSGTATALSDRLGIVAHLVPDTATVEALAEALPAGDGAVLLPRADLANPILSEVLVAKGYQPHDIVAYRTVLPSSIDPTLARRLADGDVEIVTFASSSTVRGFHRAMGSQPWQARVVSIGPVTTATCRALGIDVDREASPHDMDGLVAAVVAEAVDARHSGS